MPDKFDPYREALVVEELTEWPEEYDEWEPTERSQIERQLHEDPEQASDLQYVRVHTGFCRKISVTADDVERLA